MNEKSSETRVKRCWVCGDVGKGFNYDCLSCESCKVFFHRNAQNPERLKCRKGGNCEIDFATRKSCTKCRLDKCFASGMKWKTTEPSAKQILETGSANSTHSANSSDLRQFLEMETENMIPMSAHLKFPPKSVVRKKNYATNLNKQEKELIHELTVAMEHFVDETKLRCSAVVNNFSDVVTANLPAYYLKPIIRFCKKLSGFKTLSPEDQLLVLRPFFMEFLSVRFTFIYDLDGDGHAVLANESGTEGYFVKIETFDQMYREDEEKNKAREFAHSFRKEMEDDPTIRDLISAQLLFKHRENISSSEYMRYYYFLYCRLLRRYLEHKYKRINLALQKYSRIMRMVHELDAVQEKMPKLFQEMDPKLLSNEIIEIYIRDR